MYSTPTKPLELLRRHDRQGIRAGVGLPSVWENLQGQIFLGGERFVRKMQDALAEKAQIGEIPRA